LNGYWGALSSGVKQEGHEANQLLLSNAKIKKGGDISTPSYIFMLWSLINETQGQVYHLKFVSPCGSTAQFWALAASMKLSVSFQLLDLGQSTGLLGWVISSSQGLC
jgi:hypothetical protein